MTAFWTLENTPAPSSAVLGDGALILENRYIRRVIDRKTGVTVSIADGDGCEALSGPMREGSVSVDGVLYPLEGPCRIRADNYTML